jgi:regulator of sigma E protease
LSRHPDEPLRITVRRPLKDAEGSGASPASDEGDLQELVFEIPRQPLKQLDVVMQMGPIVSVQENSPAAEAGLRVGDVVEAVDGKRNGEGGNDAASWSAATLPEYLQAAALDGRSVELSVIRRGRSGGQAETVSIDVTPQIAINVHSPFPSRPPGTPMGADAIGIAYQIENEPVEQQAAGSSASNAGLLAGDTILSAKVIVPPSKEDAKPDTLDLRFVENQEGWLARVVRRLFGGEEAKPRVDHNWPTLLDAIQFTADGTKVELRVQRENESDVRTVTLEPMASPIWFVAARGFWFEPVQKIREAETFAEQVRYGWDETTEALTLVFRFLQKLGGQVPLTALGGPVTIAKVAGYSAAEGLPSLLIFLTMLSANLAVINFLPIPLLDGGHIVFLAYEWLRGRPANEKFVVALHTAGFVLIVTLMLYVLALDFGLIPRNL